MSRLPLDLRALNRAARGLALGAALAAALAAQSLDDASLLGTYHITRLELSAEGAVAASARTLQGSLTFDGAGGFSLQGEVLAPAQAAVETAGRYSVAFTGEVAIDDPLRPGGVLNGMISGDGDLLMGGSLNPPAGFLDVFFAVPVSEAGDIGLLNGAYTLSSFELPDADPSLLRSTLVSLRADGAGGLSEVVELGHERGSVNVRRQGAAGEYSVEADGSGELLVDGLALGPGLRRVFISPRGDYLIGLPADGFQGLVVGARRWEEGLPSDFVALYWIAEMGFDGAEFYTSLGTIVPDRVSDVLISEQVLVPGSTVDYSGRNFFAVTQGGRAWFGTEPFFGVYNMALSVREDPGFAGAAVGAQIGRTNEASDEFGIFVAVRPPLFEVGEGFFADFRGIVNGATFAQPPSPLAPGLIASIFGADLLGAGVSGAAAADATPLPTVLAGASVGVNGAPAPLFFASQFQDNFQVPYGVAGEQLTVEVSNGEEVLLFERRLAPTSPGVFVAGQDHSAYAAVVTHADGALVTAANPARHGEVVIFWVAGLGEMNPPVASGAVNPGLGGEPLARPVDQQVEILVGGRIAESVFVGAAPGFVGLAQINAAIPASAPVGERVPVAIATGNAIQDQSDLAVAAVAAVREDGDEAAQAEEKRAPRMRRIPQP